MASPLLRVLNGETLSRPPVWFMRQAGRYLPEYRELRAQAPDFISFCLNPEMAAEATLQPMRRFRFDAAIVFADILLIPKALGQEVRFEAGEGPKLGELPSLESMQARAPLAGGELAAVGETLRRVRPELDAKRALIGFAGAPWTVLTYMIEGGGSRDREKARRLAHEDPARVDALLEVLITATAEYLLMQAEAGAQVLKLFDSWSADLPEDVFTRVVMKPHRRIVARLREAGVRAPVIGFPRGAGALVEIYGRGAPVEAVALDVQASAELGRRVQAHSAIQGALDPLLLRAGGPALDARVDAMIEQWGGGPYIFNLGHGILPDTPIAHVEQVLRRIKG
jgi:uroporphyrinogen decarboxylase